MTTCQCGCRQPVRNRFVSGHNLKGLSRKDIWREDELNFLVKHYPTMSLEELAKKLNRSVVAIQIKANRDLKIKRAFHLTDLKLDDFTRGLLVGAIDGEGSLRISRSSKAHGKKLRPQIAIHNTNLEFLEKIRGRLNKCGWIRNVRQEKRCYKYKGKRRTVYTLVITGIKTVYPILRQITDGLTVKKEQAFLLKMFCESRMSNGYGSSYTNEEMNIVERIKKLNLRKGVGEIKIPVSRVA